MKKQRPLLYGSAAALLIIALVLAIVNRRPPESTFGRPHVDQPTTSLSSASGPRFVAGAEIGFSNGRPCVVRPVIYNADFTTVCVGESRPFGLMDRPFAMTCGSLVADDRYEYYSVPLGSLRGANAASFDTVSLTTKVENGRKSIQFACAGETVTAVLQPARHASDKPNGPMLVWNAPWLGAPGSADPPRKSLPDGFMVHMPVLVRSFDGIRENDLVCNFDNFGLWKSPFGYYVKDGDDSEAVLTQAFHAFVWEVCIRK